MFSFLKNSILIPAICCGLVLAPVASHAQEPANRPVDESASIGSGLNLEMPKFSYSILKKGQKLTASMDLYILAPDSFARITTEYEFMQKRYELYLGERLRLNELQYQYKIDVQGGQIKFLESELERSNNLMLELEQNRKKDLTPLWAVLSFAAGCALTVGLVYALEPGVR